MPDKIKIAPSAGFELAARLSADTDAFIGGRLFHELLEHAQPDCDIVALGGYGRRELCPASDIDLLFLFSANFDHAAAEAAVRTLVYPLWDRGLTVGLSVRSVSETITDAGHDPKLYAALLDARLICGSSAAYQDLNERFAKLTRDHHRKRFLKQLATLNAERRAAWGDARYQLEPNLKEGALRDYHCVRWYAQLLTGSNDPQMLARAGHIDQSEVAELLSAADYLIATRYWLHSLAGRKTDKLSLELIPELSETLGASDEASFMRRLHQSARQVHYVCEACEEALKPAPYRLGRFKNAASLEPIEELGRVAQGRSQPSHRLRRLLRSASLTPERLSSLLLDVLMGPGAPAALTLMLESGLLEQALPLFSAVVDLSTFDPAHTYTVDLHSIRCLEELIKLEAEMPEVLSQINDQRSLRLAALLHDIGKGSGSDHSRRGAELSRMAVRDLGLAEETAQTVADLVELHLKLADQALGRDLSDENTVYEFARLIKSPANLSMLYLLTIADTHATAPQLWNAWRASLIHELYTKTNRLLLTGEAAGKMSILNQRWQALAGESGRLWALPQAYLLSYEPKDIKAHLALTAKPLQTDEIRLSQRQHRGHTELIICARERQGLFADLSGLLALNEFKVMSARIFTWSDGTCVDRFDVRLPWEDFDAWPRLEQQYRELVAGKFDLAARLAQKKTCQIKAQISASLDNLTSDFFSLLTVDAPESSAALHAVARILSERGLNIHRAYLASRGSRATMNFYLTDLEGEKLPDEAADLLAQLASLGQTSSSKRPKSGALRHAVK